MRLRRSRRVRRIAVASALVVAALAGSVLLVHYYQPLRRDLGLPYTASGPLHTYGSSVGVRGAGATIDFTPSGRYLAYIWQEAEYLRPAKLGARPRTLAETMELRLRRMGGDAPERRIPLDSIDLRPEGEVYYTLGACVYASPDSRYVAAATGRRLVIADVETGEHRAISYDGEFFRGCAWLSGSELVFVTNDGQTVSYWRYDINLPAGERVKVYEEPGRRLELHGGLPPRMHSSGWSPNGRYHTSCRGLRPDHEFRIVDMRTGQAQTFAIDASQQCWKLDDSALLVHSRGPDARVVLIDPVTGQTQDLSAEFRAEFGEEIDFSFAAPVWTPDGQYVVTHTDRPTPGTYTGDYRGCVVRPSPFEVVLSRDRILRWSPVPGWVLEQGGRSFKWVAVSAGRTAHIRGWVNDWTWSRDGRLAAKLDGGDIEVLRPEWPPGLD